MVRRRVNSARAERSARVGRGSRRMPAPMARLSARSNSFPSSATVPRWWHPEVPGPLHNGTRRVSHRQIRAYCRVVAREFRPEKIILFGSYAYGKPTKDSDVDLLVIMAFRGRPVKQVVKIRSRVAAPFPMDLLVKSPAEIKRRLAIGCFFTREILERGKLMYEAPHH